MSDGSIRYDIDQQKINEWDSWYLWRYMTQLVFDDEQLYEIGSEWFEHEIEKSKMQKDFKRTPMKKPFGKNYFCKKCRWKPINTILP